jgi:hypothetical protein
MTVFPVFAISMHAVTFRKIQFVSSSTKCCSVNSMPWMVLRQADEAVASAYIPRTMPSVKLTAFSTNWNGFFAPSFVGARWSLACA